MKLSRTVGYGVRATLQLAEKPANVPVPCSQLAQNGNMPERFLLQILRSLVTHGILQSTRGVDGGYYLVKQPNEVSLLDMIEAIEGPYDNESDSDGTNGGTNDKLALALRQLSDNSRRELAAIKLSQLLESPKTSPASAGKEGRSSKEGKERDSLTTGSKSVQ